MSFFTIGAVEFGGVAVGGLAVDLLSFAGLAIGLFSLGGGAIGIFAAGGAAVAWQAASGGFAMANEFALGGKAIANHANNLMAKDYFDGSTFFSSANLIADYSRWLLLLLIFPVAQNPIRMIKHCGGTK